MFKQDFTILLYTQLLKEFLNQGYRFTTLKNFLNDGEIEDSKTIILRHDVDKKPENSLLTAVIENDLQIKGTYYFRIVQESNNEEIIKKIVSLGHEIGYHYEDLAMANGNFEKAIEAFVKNLSYFRTFYPVVTICMHGSPRSNYDNRDLWKHYSYRDLGLMGEPYFDIDFNKVMYLTDTGRTWNLKYSLRDVVSSSYKNVYNSTFDIFDALKAHKLPNKILITIHPQRWTINMPEWLKEFSEQKIKNYFKLFMKTIR